MNFSWDLQSFDTEIFGFKTAKISASAIGKISTIKSLLDDLQSNKIAYATLRIPANNFTLVHELERNEFLLVDGILQLEKDLVGLHVMKNGKIYQAKKDDWDGVVDLASECFYLNRFYNDTVITKQKADQIFAQWTKNSLQKKVADEVLVYKEDKNILGFVTMQKSGHIPLIAVKNSERGKGIAKQLTLEALRIICSWGSKKAAIETQTINIPALRTYIKCGFKITDSFLTFRWSSL